MKEVNAVSARGRRANPNTGSKELISLQIYSKVWRKAEEAQGQPDYPCLLLWRRNRFTKFCGPFSQTLFERLTFMRSILTPLVNAI